MPADHAEERTPKPPVEISWTPLNGKVLVVATCRPCLLFCERVIANDANAEGLALLVGAEALAQDGCTHIDAVTGARKTLRPPTRDPRR